MKFTSARNPRYTSNGAIDLLVTFDGLGEVPFVASATDKEAHGRELFNRAQAGEFGQVASYTAPIPTAAEALAGKKRQRKATVDAITVTTGSGKIFDGNEEAQSRMTRAVVVAGITGQTECTWVLANNVPTVVTLDELREAMALSLQAMGAVWVDPYIG